MAVGGERRQKRSVQKTVKHLIVAQYLERVDWLDRFPGWKPRVVTKEVDLPNLGREASSYFFAFQELYDDLQPHDLVCCLQGDPFFHALKLELEMEQPCEWFVPLGDWRVTCDMRGRPHHPGLPVAEYWRAFIGSEPPEHVEFVAGAQFLVRGEALLGFPKEFYGTLQERMSEQYAPWAMERLWWPFFESVRPPLAA